MRKTFLTIFACFTLCIFLLLSGCGGSDSVKGKWAYIHEPETVSLQLSSGKAVLDGTEYKVEEIGGDAIILSLNGEEHSFRYVLNKDGMLLYKTAVYTREGQDSSEKLIGRWVNAETKWSFEFTDDGTFREDDYFPGQYTLNEADGTFKLAYNDHFEDTVCYYSISGNELTVEYPWQMVRCR